MLSLPLPRLIFLLGAVVLPAAAQVPPPASSGWPNGVVSINGGWRIHAGDDPAFAQPTFDDSSWSKTTFTPNFILTGPDALGHSRWMRRHVALPATPGPIDLLLFADVGTLEVYVDGQRVGPTIAPSYTWERANELTYPLRPATSPAARPVASPARSVEIAIRSHAWYAQQTRRLTPRAAYLGEPAAISAFATAHSGVRLGADIFSSSVNFAALLIGMLLLVIYLRQPLYREYLWLAATVMLVAVTEGMQVATINGHIPLAVNAVVGSPAGFLFMAPELAFVYAFISRRVPPAIRVYQAALVAAPLIVAPLAWFGLVSVSAELFTASTLILPGAVLVVVLLARWYRKGSREAGLLIVPIFLLNLASTLRNVELLIRFGHPGFIINLYQSGIFSISYEPVSEILFLLTISAVIVQRFLRISQDQAKAQAELASARTIQQFLVPQAFPIIPGLHVESVYLPASQVGGDFFQILALPAGAALVVMGDVSGKGLPAAMNVAMIVGALRTLVEHTDSPAAILDGLNRRLQGRSSGFTTCLALRILPDGQTTLANAGHINPYLSGRELATDSSLPLGLDLDIHTTYPETTLTLVPGNTLTLITDGVVEATNPQTRDLFGFERTRAISHLTANEIAHTAQTFGQEDDIAVLTLTFTPQET